ncbi:glycosyl transferase family 2 [Halothece sp. PCC 7418]|uniref:glycosyltransferase family 2 protein n=1 Tax=Halothece sp. (strain PCC 7418) TaxID=65093 RepID=UPI0002A05B1B|nr:glycosyltransferase family 2 protein [Halothece sp. PCC 7418]AFZ45122.1 glycosyl transferase family 2 [Halothece sp. PCC 7418]
MKLTVCITTFNRWYSCLKTLQSVCSQMQEGLEIILVDDCSLQTMPKEVNDFIQTNNIIYVRHQHNKGLASARNTAIELASGEYFAFCDDDDAWPPHFASRLLSVLEDSPSDVGIALALPSIFNQAWQKIFSDYPKLTDLLLQGITPPVSSQAYQTKILRDVGGYDPKIQSGVDHDLWLSLAKINPRVGVTWGSPAITNTDPKANRMTTVEEKRRTKIAKSLNIWRPKIIEVFGESFYQHFYNSYQQYLDYTFFKKSLQKGEFLKAAKKAFNWRVLSLGGQRAFNKVIGYKRCNLFPAYKASSF